MVKCFHIITHQPYDKNKITWQRCFASPGGSRLCPVKGGDIQHAFSIQSFPWIKSLPTGRCWQSAPLRWQAWVAPVRTHSSDRAMRAAAVTCARPAGSRHRKLSLHLHGRNFSLLPLSLSDMPSRKHIAGRCNSREFCRFHMCQEELPALLPAVCGEHVRGRTSIVEGKQAEVGAVSPLGHRNGVKFSGASAFTLIWVWLHGFLPFWWLWFEVTLLFWWM